MEFRTFKILGWVGYILVGAIVVLIFSAVSASLASLFFVVFLLGTLLVAWTNARMQDQLDNHDGSIPMPGIYGLLGVDIVDGSQELSDDTPELAPATSCPECGYPCLMSETRCINCGASLLRDLSSVPPASLPPRSSSGQ